jgi:hypothetical protein
MTDLVHFLTVWKIHINIGPGINKPNVIACGADSGMVNCLNNNLCFIG